jgi:hypothetical protein
MYILASDSFEKDDEDNCNIMIKLIGVIFFSKRYGYQREGRRIKT